MDARAMDGPRGIITRFYNSLDAKDADGMIACYHEDVTFNDPVFGELDAPRAAAMWRMLTAQATDLQIRLEDIQVDGDDATARVSATYTMSPSGRKVHNKIHARFRFQDGLIVRHDDHFDLWRWTRMALGTPGLLLGWTPLMRNQVRSRVRRALEKTMAREAKRTDGPRSR
jgi:ketosteroid isomerase-like protein